MPLQASLALNHLKGGPLDEVPLATLDIFSKSMTNFLMQTELQDDKAFFLLTEE